MIIILCYLHSTLTVVSNLKFVSIVFYEKMVQLFSACENILCS